MGSTVEHVEMLVAIDALDDLVHHGKKRPFHRSEVRVDREAFRAGLARVRAGMRLSIPDVVAPSLGGPIGRLERLCEDGAMQGDRLTVNVDAVYDELDAARVLAVEDVKRQRGY
jgi:hypothetical protein